MLTALLPLLAQAAVAPPQTINGIELGDSAKFATPGPARVCMQSMVITPREGETAYLEYSGIHAGGIKLVLADGGQVTFTLGDIFLDQRRGGQGPVVRERGMRAYQFEDRRDVFYQVHAVPQWEWSNGRWQPLVVVAGPALAGNRSDNDLFDRLSFDWSAQPVCDRRYNFGWEVILDGEPIDETSVP